jgi:hypothetical protein
MKRNFIMRDKLLADLENANIPVLKHDPYTDEYDGDIEVHKNYYVQYGDGYLMLCEYPFVILMELDYVDYVEHNEKYIEFFELLMNKVNLSE